MKNNAAKKEFFIKSGDILIVVFIISFSLLVFFIPRHSSSTAIIKTPDRNLKVNLSEDHDIPIHLENGHMLIRVKDGKIRVVESTCPLKLCVKRGWISKVGEMIVCVPNRVSIEVVRGKKTSIDLQTW